MTICFVASLPGVVLAAADTRIGLQHPGGVRNHDGPDDLTQAVQSLGRSLFYPYRQRKIRFLGDGGWAVAAGEFATASLYLDELRSASASEFLKAQACLDQVRASVEERAQRETAFTIEQLRKTFVLGAPWSSNDVVWKLGSGPDDPRSLAAPGNYAANRPLDISDPVWLPAELRFQEEFVQACNAQDLVGLVTAAARFLATVSPHSAEASLRAQIGVTFPGDAGGYVARYFDGVASDLAKLEPANFLALSEAAS